MLSKSRNVQSLKLIAIFAGGKFMTIHMTFVLPSLPSRDHTWGLDACFVTLEAWFRFKLENFWQPAQSSPSPKNIR